MIWVVLAGVGVACCVAEWMFVREVVRMCRDKSRRRVSCALAVAVAVVDCIGGGGCLAYMLRFYMNLGIDGVTLPMLVFCLAICPVGGMFLWLVTPLALLLLVASPPLAPFLPIILPMAAVSCCAQVVRFKVMRRSPERRWWETWFVFHVTYWPETLALSVMAIQ